MPHPNLPEPAYAIPVDFLPASALPLRGKLGLTCAPGRWAPGRSPDSDLRLREDLLALAGQHDAKVLVTLLEPHEIAQLGDLKRASRRAGLAWLPLPIPDGWVPADMASARALVGKIVGALEQGENVVVHCWGGIGRTGTIAACCLVALGCPPERAIRLVRAARGGAVQSPAQEQFVLSFAEGDGGLH